MKFKNMIMMLLCLILVSDSSKAFRLTVRTTAYNASSSQTDSTPFITATGTRARVGVVALSRDLLAFIPYGSRVQIVNLRGSGCGGWNTGILRVEDTMHARKRNQADVLLGSYRSAINWGVCTGTLEVISRPYK